MTNEELAENRATFISKDNNYQDENTIYWFDVTGEFEGEWGVCDHNGDLDIVDNECCPVELNTYTSDFLLQLCQITDEIRLA